jgi:putative tryptophan/tyrosine transport system substrate-binding protein
MKRREFIALVGGAAASSASWPRAARAQQAMPWIGWLRSAAVATESDNQAAFRQGLKQAGFVEGQNVAIESRSADNQPDRLPPLVADFIRRRVAVIVANTPAALAAKAATTSVPIVFSTGGDPVKEKLVASMNRPGGNVTGVVFLNAILGGKRFELLRQVVPKATVIGLLVNTSNYNTDQESKDVQAAAQAVGQQLISVDIRSDHDIEPAFATLVQRGAGAVFVGAGAMMNSNRERIAALAARHRLPAAFSWREAAVAGGLMSYGASQSAAYRQAGVYAGRILKGEKPADLPVVQSTTFEFVINLKTAKALGIELHPQLLATADEVIE